MNEIFPQEKWGVMLRLSREQLLYDGCYAHVISRSIRQMWIYNDEEDFEQFKELLLISKRKYPYKLFHYCLMQTHFHMAVCMVEVEKFSRAMQYLKSRYVSYFHEKYKLSGPVWRERYRALLIENENYMYTCGQYIEHNPVKAGMVSGACDWKYSSSQHYERALRDELVDDYEGGTPRKMPLDIEDDGVFTGGNIIGSTFFEFEFNKSLKGKAGV